MDTGTPDISSGLHDLLAARRDSIARAQSVVSLLAEFVKVALPALSPEIRQHFKHTATPNALDIQILLPTNIPDKREVIKASCSAHADGTISTLASGWYEKEGERLTLQELSMRNGRTSSATYDSGHMEPPQIANRVLAFWARKDNHLEQFVTAGFAQLEQAVPRITYRLD